MSPLMMLVGMLGVVLALLLAGWVGMELSHKKVVRRLEDHPNFPLIHLGLLEGELGTAFLLVAVKWEALVIVPIAWQAFTMGLFSPFGTERSDVHIPLGPCRRPGS